MSTGRGLFITFEGPDGGGKTTQAALLATALAERGISVVQTREPGGDVVGERVRDLLLHSDMDARAELLLFAAARAQNVQNVLRPALGSGAVVVCDRFIDSTAAYQGYGRGLSLSFIESLNAFATDGLKPDLTFLLDLPPMQAVSRHAVAKRNRLDNEPADFHERVRAGFLVLAAAETERFLMLDGAADVESVSATVLRHVLTLLGRV